MRCSKCDIKTQKTVLDLTKYVVSVVFISSIVTGATTVAVTVSSRQNKNNMSPYFKVPPTGCILQNKVISLIQ